MFRVGDRVRFRDPEEFPIQSCIDGIVIHDSDQMFTRERYPSKATVVKTREDGFVVAIFDGDDFEEAFFPERFELVNDPIDMSGVEELI